VAEQQMVEVAKALSSDARILIMDEPTSALTESEIDELFSAIGRLTKRGVAVIYISHRMEELARVGHRATVMRDGRYIATRPLPCPIPTLVRLMANRDITQHFPTPTRKRGAPLLEVEGISHPPRLQDVSFTLHRGEILGVAGLLGAGRTELARAIAGAALPAQGRVLLDGGRARVVTLSGGNQQKVVLGKWLAAGADVLIVDEPTRGIDVAAKMEIYQLLDRLAAGGAGILMISSDLPEILGMSDRVLVMHQGRVQAVLDAHEATQERVLQAALGLAS